MADKRYEILNPIRLPSGEVRTDGVVTLDENDEITKKFLDYEAIQLVPGQESDQGEGQEGQGGDGDAPPENLALTIPNDAGRDELLANGYDADDKVRAATDEELIAIDGIGPKTLEKIRAALA